MTLTKEDLEKIRGVIDEIVAGRLEPVRTDLDTIKQGLISEKADLQEIKEEVSILSRLNQLDEIRKYTWLKAI